MNAHRLVRLSILLVLLCAVICGTAQAQQPGAAERVDALKANLAANQAALPDGTQYASETTLNAPAKNLTVVVQNSGYEKMAN